MHNITSFIIILLKIAEYDNDQLTDLERRLIDLSSYNCYCDVDNIKLYASYDRRRYFEVLLVIFI